MLRGLLGELTQLLVSVSLRPEHHITTAIGLIPEVSQLANRRPDNEHAVKILFIHFVLLASFGNTVLRPDIDSDVTLFRVLAPILCIYIFFKMPLGTSRIMLWFIGFAAYSTILAFSYSSDMSQFIPSIVHYAYIFLLYIVMKFYQRLLGVRFERSYFRFIGFTIVFIFLCLGFELLLGNPFPNLYFVGEDDLQGLRAFYWNQNDLAVVLCAFGWIILTRRNTPILIKTLYAIAAGGVLVLNGSKSALAAFIIVIILANAHFIVSRFQTGIHLAKGFLAISIFLIAGLFLFYGDLEFSTVQGTYTLNGLFVHPIANIMALNPSGEQLGSINNRIDATIFVLIEYFRSYGAGLGPGGSWLVLTLPQYTLGGAQSPHNALLQLLVDFGYPVLLGYGYLTFWALRVFFRRDSWLLDRARATAILSFPILGLSQSGAIVTNYTFISICFFLLLANRHSYETTMRR